MPVHFKDWHLLRYAFDDKYYFSTVFSFGLWSSPALFNRLADFLGWMIRINRNCPDFIHHMDNFLFSCGATTTTNCQLAPSYMHAICDDVGVPLAPVKC